MNELTLKALKESISKWKAKRDDDNPPDVMLGPNRCPLCRLFHPSMGGKNSLIVCDGCPVRKKTGYGWCDNTPYGSVLDLHESWDSEINTLEQWKAACQEEIDFLTSLLPNQDPDGTTPA